MKKVAYINAIKFPIDEEKLAEFKTTISQHPYKGVREDAFSQAIQMLTGMKGENIVTKNGENLKYLSDYLDEIIKEAKVRKENTNNVSTSVTETPTTPVAVVAESVPTPEAVVVATSAKDFYKNINFSKKKKDWPADEREAAINTIKKEINSNTELADALGKLQYNSE